MHVTIAKKKQKTDSHVIVNDSVYGNKYGIAKFFPAIGEILLRTILPRQCKPHKDIDAVVVFFANTTDFEGYNWHLGEMACNRIVNILKRNDRVP
jgi:hypothetical protein